MEPIFECNKNRIDGFEHAFYITSVITEDKGYEVLPHWHYHFELLYFAYGNAKVCVGNVSFKVKGGELVLISPCEVHSVSIEANVRSKHFIIGFDTELLNVVSNINFEIKYFLPNVIDANPAYRVLRLHPCYNINSLLDEFQFEYSNKLIGFELASTANIYKLMSWILRHLYNNGLVLTADSALLKNNIMKVMKVLNYIDKHFNENITATMAADMCFLSYSHFSKLFKNVMHTTFIDYLNHFRVKKAESLLLDGDKNITQIALEIGFNDTSYFIKHFKHYKGISPKQYQTSVNVIIQ